MAAGMGRGLSNFFEPKLNPQKAAIANICNAIRGREKSLDDGNNRKFIFYKMSFLSFVPSLNIIQPLICHAASMFWDNRVAPVHHQRHQLFGLIFTRLVTLVTFSIPWTTFTALLSSSLENARPNKNT